MIGTSTLSAAGSDNRENKLYSTDSLLATEERNRPHRQGTEVRALFHVFKFPPVPCRQGAPANYHQSPTAQLPSTRGEGGDGGGFRLLSSGRQQDLHISNFGY